MADLNINTNLKRIYRHCFEALILPVQFAVSTIIVHSYFDQVQTIVVNYRRNAPSGRVPAKSDDPLLGSSSISARTNRNWAVHKASTVDPAPVDFPIEDEPLNRERIPRVFRIERLWV